MAKVIIDLNELSNSFEDCCKRFSYVSFLTAWAGDHEVVSCLDEYRTKIVRSVVGLHFYQTSPNFIIDLSYHTDHNALRHHYG